MQEKMDRLLENMLSTGRKENNSEITTDVRNVAAHIGLSSLNIPRVTNIEFGFP